MYIQATGKRGRHKKEIHHLEIHAAEGGTHESPAWLVTHHHVDARHEPEQFQFDNHREMLAHVEQHTGTEEEGGE